MAFRRRRAEKRHEEHAHVDFNHVRPHEALGMQTPSEIYRPSPRRPITQVGALRAGSDFRALDHTGWLSWNSQRVYVTSALSGHTVRLVRTQGVVAVWFYDLMLGTFMIGGAASVDPPGASAQA